MTSDNRLLAALSSRAFARVSPFLDVIPMTLKTVLHKPGESVEHVYFPGGGFCSVLTLMADGTMVEIATIGREGMVGLSAVVNGRARELSTTMVQAECSVCYRLSADVFELEMDRRGEFRSLLRRYGHALLGVVMQSTGCNAVHSIEQRLARWLLMAHDRVERDEFPLTQEFAAMMLGATRPTVTVVAGMLQKAGLITYRRGRVVIVDRRGLEHMSCECYGIAAALLAGVTNGGRA